jgi:threonine/homoserine/homoserine lactone efflux protein
VRRSSAYERGACVAFDPELFNREGVVIDGSAVVGVFSVYIAGVVSPGPNFVAVAHKAASATRIEALAMVAGIVLVNLFWASCAILGVGIVFATFPWLALVVRIAGACYLLWFGGRLIFNASAYRRGKMWVDRVCGGLIVALGMRQLIR